MDDVSPRGPGRFLLRALAIASALGFLTLVMVQAAAFYGPPPEPPKRRPHLLGPATKAAPVVRPPPLEQPGVREVREIREDLDLFPATKAGTLGRLRISQPPRPPQPWGTPLPRD